MTIRNTLRGVAYDHPATEVRQCWQTTIGAGADIMSNTAFIAHADTILMALSGIPGSVGISTFTGTQFYNGGTDTCTVHVATQQLQVLRIYQTATNPVTGSAGGMYGTGAVTLATDTIAVGYPTRYYANGTSTGQVGAPFQFAINQSALPDGYNGYRINAGDSIVIKNGTDTAASHYLSLEWQIAPNANLIA